MGGGGGGSNEAPLDPPLVDHFCVELQLQCFHRF